MFSIFVTTEKHNKLKRRKNINKQVGKGVRRDENTLRIHYLTSEKHSGRGVFDEDMIYKYINTNKNTYVNMLFVNRPCVCGSLNHTRTNHMNCLLNPRYNDVI